MLFRAFSLSLLACVCACSFVIAAPKQGAKNLVATDLSQVDADFSLQGEYLGYQKQNGRRLPIGLQVIARGDGKFDGVRYAGGLPGNGWNRQDKLPYEGQSTDAGLVLLGEGDSITIVGTAATLHDSSSNPIGKLRKVNRRSPTFGLPPAAGATILFDGSSADHFNGGKLTPEGLLLAGGLTKVPVGDFRLHLEFRTPYKPYASGQNRGNSGVYIQERYEVQILDSFGEEGVENEAGGLYRQRRPDQNMALPPLSWQTYDIYFRAARWDDVGNKTENVRITVRHNGIAIHDNIEVPKKTGAGKKEENTRRPIRLQDHGNPVTFRNIWIVLGEEG